MSNNRVRSAPSPGFQKKQMTKMRKQNKALSDGDRVYILNGEWYTKWKKHIKDPEKYPSPGPINNGAITDEEEIPILKPDLVADKDYKILSFSEWRLFKNWYEGGPVVPRNVISEGDIGMIRVEAYLVKVPVVLSDSNGAPSKKHTKLLHFSKYTNVAKITAKCESLFKLPHRSCRLWAYGEDHTEARLLSDRNETLDDIMLADDEQILVEQRRSNGYPRNDDGSVKKKGFSLFSIFNFGGKKETNESSGAIITSKKINGTPGLCGLSNLGNTCFMNSGIQCLSNVPTFKDYFTNNDYKKEINTKNIIGMGGHLANQYGAIIKAIWEGNANSIAPRSFKKVISKFAPQFSGMNQHDAQELIGFLLDGLHEDLNRVYDKPYVEEEEANGREDSIFAIECWENHLKRNRSIVVDLFHGQLKSTVECPDCGKISVKFDPFMYLSVPLSQERDSLVEIIVIRANDRNMPKKYGTILRKHSTYKNLLGYISEKTGLEHSEDKPGFFITEIFNSKIQKVFKPETGIISKKSSTYVIAYEKPSDLKRCKAVKILHRKEKKITRYVPYKLFAIPFISYVPAGITGKELYKLMYKRCKRFMVKKPAKAESESEEIGKKVIEIVDNSDDSSLFTLSDSLSSSSSDFSSSADTEKGPLEYSDSKYGSSQEREFLSWEEFIEDLPWTLHHVSTTGTKCAYCSDKGCRGCLIKPNKKKVDFPDAKTYTIAISWSNEALKNVYNSKLAYGVELDKSLVKTRKNLQNKKNGHLSVEQCVELFTMNEQLGDSDKWYCSDCKEFREAYKKFDIWKLPRVLIIQLKRFVWEGNHRGRKNNDTVNFPLFGLNFDDYVLNEEDRGVRYNLTGVVTHSGGLSGGHYTAYCRNEVSKEWFLYNDSKVTKLNDLSSIPNGAYVLFYVREEEFDYSPEELALRKSLLNEDIRDSDEDASSITSQGLSKSSKKPSKTPKQEQSKDGPDSEITAKKAKKSGHREGQSSKTTREQSETEPESSSSKSIRSKKKRTREQKETESKSSKSRRSKKSPREKSDSLSERKIKSRSKAAKSSSGSSEGKSSSLHETQEESSEIPTSDTQSISISHSDPTE